MKCPKCKSKSKVYDSRANGETIRRRRRCLKCKHRYATIEILEVKADKLDELMGGVKDSLDDLCNINGAPKRKKYKYKPVNRRKPTVKEMDFESMTDEELEALIYGD